MIIITELLKDPIDEGSKVAAYKILGEIKKICSAVVFSINGDIIFDAKDRKYSINKFLVNMPFLIEVRNLPQPSILYIPKASLTFFSVIRAKIINIFTGKDVFVYSFQPKNYGFISRRIVQLISPKCVFIPGKVTSQHLTALGVNNRILSLGVDDNKYYEFDCERKTELRKQHEIEERKIVFLHVGHIQNSRNLEWLIDVKGKCPEIEVLIVGSTYNKNDSGLYSKLQDAGIRIITNFISDMEDIYNLADYYVFPVLKNDGAIETPLSVLEAMACNVPIVTSRFGSLPDTFKQDKDFHYVGSSDEIVDIIRNHKKNKPNNREKIKPYTWGHIARRVVEIIES